MRNGLTMRWGLAVVPVIFVACALAQTVARIAPIASALHNKEFEKALELLHPALQEFPGNAELWTMQGVAHAGLGKKKDALASFRKALQISPDNIPALQGAA